MVEENELYSRKSGYIKVVYVLTNLVKINVLDNNYINVYETYLSKKDFNRRVKRGVYKLILANGNS